MKKIIYFAILVLFFLLFSSSLYYTQERQAKNTIDKNFKLLNSLIHDEMNLDDASNILRNNGFVVWEKKRPSANKNYYKCYIPLSKKIPWSSTIAEIFGTSSEVRVYAIIKADPEKKIISIQH